MNKIEEFEAFRKGSIALGAVDLSSSNTPEDISPTAIISPDIIGVSGNYGETMPPELRVLMAACVFNQMPGLENIDGKHVVIAPQTSTLLVKEALVALQRQSAPSRKPAVILYPEGNFRYNFHVEEFTNTSNEYVPLEKPAYKISAKSLRKSIRDITAEGKTATALVLETPNNPWMQIYSKNELGQIAEVCAEYRIPIIQDLYLAGNESPGKEQALVEEIARDLDLPLKIMTVTGTRRQFGADIRGKIGAAAIRDEEWRQLVLELRSSEHMRFSRDDVLFLQAVLPTIPYNNLDLRQALHERRENAIPQITALNGLTILVHPQAGPFAPVGFQKECRQMLAKAGFTNAYHCAEVLAIKGVSLLPLEDMNTPIMGFRVNVAYPDRTAQGLPIIKTFLEEVRRGEIHYRHYDEQIAERYESLDLENDPRLSVTALKNQIATLHSKAKSRSTYSHE